MVEQVISGGPNATVFAYGVTGSGKTHTMSGPNKKPQQGVIYLTIRALFDQIDIQNLSDVAQYTVIMSYF